MKVLFTQDALVNAGAERSHLEILSRFSEEMNVGFVYFYPKHDLKPEYERAGFRLFFLDIPESYHFHLAVYRLVRLIRKEKPDLLISSLWRAEIITRIASLITGVPLVGTLVNDSYSSIAWTDKKGFKHKIVYWLDRLTAVIPIHWIANAQALADSHVKTLGIKKDKISVVYRGRPVIADVIAPARRGGSEERPKQFLTDHETASASEASILKPEIDSRSLAVTGNVIASAAKQSLIDYSQQREETASAANDTTEQLGIGESSLAVTSSEETASPADGSEINLDFPESPLAMTIPIRNFISYGRLLERKGFQDAIKAFSQVFQTYPNCMLTIFGEGLYRQELERQIEYLGLENSVFLPGKIPNPMDALINGYYLQTSSTRQVLTTGFDLLNSRCSSAQPDNCQLLTADCFVFPSWYEGFSGALVEAMMVGIPIIASDIPMNLEAVTDQKSTLVFPVQNVSSLTQKMLWAIENPDQMRAIGNAARMSAIDRFDIEKIAVQYEQTLFRIANQVKQS